MAKRRKVHIDGEAWEWVLSDSGIVVWGNTPKQKHILSVDFPREEDSKWSIRPSYVKERILLDVLDLNPPVFSKYKGWWNEGIHSSRVYTEGAKAYWMTYYSDDQEFTVGYHVQHHNNGWVFSGEIQEYWEDYFYIERYEDEVRVNNVYLKEFTAHHPDYGVVIGTEEGVSFPSIATKHAFLNYYNPFA